MTKKADFRNIDGMQVEIYSYKAIIIGSGCAGLNSADSLYDLGIRDIAIITNGLELSTSINTGSDKQTYYKLSTSGSEADSVYDMAKTLYSGGCMEGYQALTEAAMSLRCFYKLISLGVDFPKNSYGEYVGYRTDHDTRKRATSCGPLTSHMMAKALIDSVKNKNIDIFENKRAIKILTDNKRACGVVAIDTESGMISVYMSPNIVIATGGPSGVYLSSVYPKSHIGSLSLAMEAGCEAVNLTEWQYGIASLDFRWNLSGTYMQVIPRFVSVDTDGREYEFLSDYISDDTFTCVFQKGYNWPFSPSKLGGDNHSSLIDIAVYSEIKNGRRVFLDYTKNDSAYSFELLSDEAKEYLVNSGVSDIERPIDKLRFMNEKAYRLYLDKAGIDLEKQLLEIGVCAQHCNGGISCDENYMTCVDGLYAVGECAGVFGVARPGGTALNSTQVSSLKSAEHIACTAREEPSFYDFLPMIRDIHSYCLSLLDDHADINGVFCIRRNFSEMMSGLASFIRIPENIDSAYAEASRLLSSFENNNKVSHPRDVYEALTNRDILISALCMLEAQKRYACEGFRSRGSFLCLDSEQDLANINNVVTESDKETVIKIRYEDRRTVSYLDKVSDIPKSEQWFEKIYNEYYDKKL